ncbi:MAG: putative manganese-dependent inorganic diphosphatase [Bacilli bacterium]|nr:putative manganese-dependent inorganic diphosphatase [Bacilli bacterium]
MAKTLIFGHQKPDTDSVTSAIVLSYLKNKLGFNTEPRVLGDINNETKFVLDYFGFKTPKYLSDVRLQVRDVKYNKNCFLYERDSVFHAYKYMNETKVSTIPVVDDNGFYLGAISMKYITNDLIDGNLGFLDASYDNILESLQGKKILKFDEEIKGNIILPSYKSETFKEVVPIDKGSIIIVGDRYKIIEHAIQNKVSLIILDNGVTIGKELLDLAKKNRINIISTKYSGVFSANLSVLSNYIRNKMEKAEIITVNENDSLYDALELANRKKFSNYPVLNNAGKCLGIFCATISNNKRPKQVILVDHNEIEQSVIGLDEAEIIEVVDHHKIGNIGTSLPINFRNMPLGSTNTILYLMFKERNVKIPKDIAGLMLSGIISDTLLLSSPTTTEVDKKVLLRLSEIAGVDYEKYGMEMFKAGSSIKGKSVGEVIHGDFKVFMVDNQKIGVGQVSTMNTEEIIQRQDEFVKALNELAHDEDYAAIALFVTDIMKNGSYIFYNEDSTKIFAESFNYPKIKEGTFFKGVVSRKKQIIPKIMNYMDNNS